MTAEIDPAALEQLRGLTTETGGDLIVELIDVFDASTVSLLADLADALATGAMPAATRYAHTLKGAASTVGAVHVADCARAVEHLAQEGRAADAAALVPTLRALVPPALAALRAASGSARSCG